ncbi:MAG: ABC transporter ATP-binding protein [Promethearchaeota archaeon]
MKTKNLIDSKKKKHPEKNDFADKTEISSLNLKILGINEEKYRNLSYQDRKNFLKLLALDETIFVKNIKKRKKFPSNNKYNTSFRQVLSYLWDPYKNLFIITLILSLVQSLLFLSLPLGLQKGINDLISIKDTTKDLLIVVVDFIMIMGLLCILAAVMYVRVYLNNWIGNRIIKNLRDDLFKKIQESSFRFLDLNQSGDLISRSTSDINLLKTLLSSQLAMFFRQTFTVFMAIGAMFYINIPVASFVCIPIPVIFIVMIYYRKKIQPIFIESRKTYGALTSRVQENIMGMRVVRAFSQEQREIQNFGKLNDQYFEQNQKLIFYRASFEPFVRVIANFCIIIILSLGTGLIGEILNVGDLFALLLLVNFSIDPLFFLSQFIADMPKVGATCDRIVSLLNNTMQDPEENLPDLPPINGEIEFNHVNMSYEHNTHYELKDISFKTKPGEHIAILGATGSGKSTLMRLIPRFYPISEGSIRIDGNDIYKYNIRSLRAQIGVVPQETFLFGRSIYENLTLGKQGASMSEVIKATKLANIHEFIESLPNKYKNLIGERGITLSGGQRQRMAIARALITKPRILILDDATSAVDVDTEYEIQKSFSSMFVNCTTFIITQRLSTVRNADRIIVLSHGKISEQGSHQELIKKTDGIYNLLYKTLKIDERA